MSPADKYPANTNDHELENVDMISPVITLGEKAVASSNDSIAPELREGFEGFTD